MNKFKNMVLAGALLSAPVVLAEGAPTMDTTAAETMLSSAQTGLTSLLSSAAPIVTAIVLAGLAIWGAMVIIRILKKAFSRAS